MSKNKWTTYRTTGYTHDVANDQLSAGGVHLHQVRRNRNVWQTQICQTNARHISYGPTKEVSAAEGETLWSIAAKG